MLRSGIFPITIATLYLVIYVFLLNNQKTIWHAYMMFFFSPVVIFGMVYMVLKYGKYDGPNLENDEFGYQDKPKEELDIF